MINRTALDGARRRRLYLFRHGAVDYLQPSGDWVEDPDIVPLSGRGRSQADAMAALFRDIFVDRAICSGLPRTRQTAEIVLASREIVLEEHPAFEEIRPRKGEAAGGYDVFDDVAFSHWRANDPAATFLGGERYSDFYRRIEQALQDLLAESDWNNLAVFAHGGTNAAILGWVTGVGLDAFGLIDQATGCLNIIDFDVNDDSKIRRKVVRAMNVTADDPVMRHRHSGDMESMASLLLKLGGG